MGSPTHYPTSTEISDAADSSQNSSSALITIGGFETLHIVVIVLGVALLMVTSCACWCLFDRRKNRKRYDSAHIAGHVRDHMTSESACPGEQTQVESASPAVSPEMFARFSSLGPEAEDMYTKPQRRLTVETRKGATYMGDEIDVRKDDVTDVVTDEGRINLHVGSV